MKKFLLLIVIFLSLGFNSYASILDETILTNEEIVKMEMNKIAYINRTNLQGLKDNYIKAFNVVWHNSKGRTAQQILDGYGTNAANLFVESEYLKAVILRYDPDWVAPQPTNEVTINNDGTVTVIGG